MPAAPPGWPTPRGIGIREPGVRPRLRRIPRPAGRRRPMPVHRSRTTPPRSPRRGTLRSPAVRRIPPAGRSAPTRPRPVVGGRPTVLRPAHRMGRSLARRGIGTGRSPILPGGTGALPPATPVAGPHPFRHRPPPRRGYLRPTGAPRRELRTPRPGAERHLRNGAILRGAGNSRLALPAHREEPKALENPDLPASRRQIPGTVPHHDPTARPATRHARVIGAALASSRRPTR
jgi:hypothetical protein